MTRKQKMMEWLNKRASDAAVEAQEWEAEAGELRQAAQDLAAGKEVSEYLIEKFEKIHPKRKRGMKTK